MIINGNTITCSSIHIEFTDGTFRDWTVADTYYFIEDDTTVSFSDDSSGCVRMIPKSAIKIVRIYVSNPTASAS